MKATGIVRRIDDLGRVVMPKEIRRSYLNIQMKTNRDLKLSSGSGLKLSFFQ